MNQLYFVTGNSGKASEAQSILGFPVHITSVDIDEIQSLQLENIVQKKAEKAFEKIGKPLFVDDVGLWVEVWNGFPGPFIKYLLAAGKNELLLQMLKNETNRRVVAKAAIGYHDGNTTHIFIGEVSGSLSTELRGAGGWGFDPVFIPEGTNQTFAEMGPEKKNTLSHRRKALEKFRTYLQEKQMTFL